MFSRIKPQYFDLLGILTFPFIFFVALYALWANQPLSIWTRVALLLIGVFGTAIDGQIVYHYFIKRDEH